MFLTFQEIKLIPNLLLYICRTVLQPNCRRNHRKIQTCFLKSVSSCFFALFLPCGLNSTAHLYVRTVNSSFKQTHIQYTVPFFPIHPNSNILILVYSTTCFRRLIYNKIICWAFPHEFLFKVAVSRDCLTFFSWIEPTWAPVPWLTG